MECKHVAVAMKTRNRSKVRDLNDLFTLFPELPRIRKPSVDRDRQVAEMKKRAEEVRRRVAHAVRQRNAATERVRLYLEAHRMKRQG